MSSAAHHMRHRTGGKTDAAHDENENDRASPARRNKHFHTLKSNNVNYRYGAGLHGSVWNRVVGIVGLFTMTVVLLSRLESSPSHIKARAGDGNPLFVTIVMPSVVNPKDRPLRLANIAKTWGAASRAVYVVHDTGEFPEGARVETHDGATYPQILLVPPHISSEQGVQRLEHVVRTIAEEIDPHFAFFVNDHTFVLPQHLCAFLQHSDSDRDLYAGHALKGNHETVFNSGAAGYVLSRSTLHKLIAKWDEKDKDCTATNASKWLQGNPGLVTAQCFERSLKIPVIDTRDNTDQSHKFHAFGLVRTVSGKVDDWYINKHQLLDQVFHLKEDPHHRHLPLLPTGTRCCSSQTVSFHYVESGESLALHQLLEKVAESPNISNDDLKKWMMNTWPRNREGLGFYAHGLPGGNDPAWKDLMAVVRKISIGMNHIDGPPC